MAACASFRAGWIGIHKFTPSKALAKVGGQRGWLSDPLDRNGEHISDAALGLDNSRRAGLVSCVAGPT